MTTNRAPADGVGRDDLATTAQVRALYVTGDTVHRMTKGEVVEACMTAYGRSPEDLSRREASVLIKRFQRTDPIHLGSRPAATPAAPAAPDPSILDMLVGQGFRIVDRYMRSAVLKREDGAYIVMVAPEVIV